MFCRFSRPLSIISTWSESSDLKHIDRQDEPLKRVAGGVGVVVGSGRRVSGQ